MSTVCINYGSARRNEVKADTLRESVPFINDNPDITGVSRSNIPAMTSQTCSHGKHVHMNKNNVDGTGSPSNKITWILCSSTLPFVKA